MSRHEAREIAFKLVFSYGFDKENNVDEYEEMVQGLDDDSLSYVSTVYNGVKEHYDELLKDISDHAEKFALDRLFKVDLSILILAIYEIKYVSSIPFKVSVDEALSLAASYSTEKSKSFINGILAKFGEK